MSKYRVETNIPEAEPKFDVSNSGTIDRKLEKNHFPFFDYFV